ncbi:hypothetical protein GWI33_021304 [Rhynchophorus ferrugineus]|uniref:alpha-1,2-Mannosidase n=1 Tax=Rhynchophorus ferrugineus TaxID=354439 RepID=A0A834M3E6_RHYFE|nr:hypothetical protein GWI33_021304 [Rhynchophorus ferrugineus]
MLVHKDYLNLLCIGSWWMLCILPLCITEEIKQMSNEERTQLREQARDMFYHAYNAYMENAYPADELMPLSCQGRFRGLTPNRGDIDDSLGNFSLTLIDTLDTLVILGDFEEFEHGVKLVIRDVNFDNDIVVSVFETNIRIVGGLLSAHILADLLQQRDDIMPWYKGELLDMAKDVGYRLLPAFNTTTGIPYSRVNLRYGIKSDRLELARETCTACAGSMILEMAALSRLTGEPIFEEKAHKAMDELWKMRHRSSDLMGTVLNVHSGDWVRRDSGVGAGIDSYYEYCLKAYILLGDNKYLNRFNRHYNAIMKYIYQGPMLLDVHMHRPHTTSRNYMDALLAFWPGLQVLKGDIKPAVETHEMLYQVMQRHKFIPEAFTTDFQVHWGNHPLRPEFLESTYFLYSATGDPYYLDVGKNVLKSLQKYARVPCGYAAVNDVRTGKQEDRMDSFVLAETLKYLYLLFADKDDVPLNLDQFIFTTEGHLFPLTLSGHGVNCSVTVSEMEIENSEFATSCPNTLSLFPDAVRRPLKDMVDGMCPRRSSKRRLTVSEFSAANINHLKILKEMGISIIALQDGRVQLLHTPSMARSALDAEDGLLFMQEMAEFSKLQTQPETTPQMVSFPLKDDVTGKIEIATAQVGPAQFGETLKGAKILKGKAMKFNPYNACSDSVDSQLFEGKIAIIGRGDCMFIDKVRRVQKHKAIAAIVTDNVPGSNPTSSPMFSMSGDGTEDVKIPAVFMFSQDAERLLIALNSDPDIEIVMGEMKGSDLNTQSEESMFHKLKASVQEFLNKHTGLGFDKVVEKNGFKAVIDLEKVTVTFDRTKGKPTLSKGKQPASELTSAIKGFLEMIEQNKRENLVLPLNVLRIYYKTFNKLENDLPDTVKQTEWLLEEISKDLSIEPDDHLVNTETPKEPLKGTDVKAEAHIERLNDLMDTFSQLQILENNGVLQYLKKEKSSDDLIVFDVSENEHSNKEKPTDEHKNSLKAENIKFY